MHILQLGFSSSSSFNCLSRGFVIILLNLTCNSMICLSRNVFNMDELAVEIAQIAVPAALALAADPVASLIDTAFIGHLGLYMWSPSFLEDSLHIHYLISFLFHFFKLFSADPYSISFYLWVFSIQELINYIFVDAVCIHCCSWEIITFLDAETLLEKVIVWCIVNE